MCGGRGVKRAEVDGGGRIRMARGEEVGGEVVGGVSRAVWTVGVREGARTMCETGVDDGDGGDGVVV